MPINKSFPVENGASPAYHIVTEIKIKQAGAVALINSYLAEPISGTSPRVSWQDTYPLASDVESWSIASAEAWLISQDGPFAGGTLTQSATPIEQLRAELIATAARRRKELRKVYTHDFGEAPDVDPVQDGNYGMIPFDSDEASSSNILAIVAGPVLAEIAEPQPVEYKCADDAYRTFSFAEFRTMAFALSAYVQGLHTRERELLELIADAGDDAEALIALAPVVKAFNPP